MAAPQTQYPSAAFPQTQHHGAAYPQPFQGGGYGFGHHPMTDGGMAPPQIQYHGAAYSQLFQGGGYGFGQDHWQQKQQQQHLPTPPPAGPLSTQPTRLPYAKSSKEPSTMSIKQPSQESDSVEVDMDGWQVAPPNLGNDVDDLNNTDDFVTYFP